MDAIFDGAVFSTKPSSAGSVFGEVQVHVLHSEAIYRKHDSTHQDVAIFNVRNKDVVVVVVAFFRRRFVVFGGKKW